MSDHIRQHHSLLAAAERRLLLTLARRMPAAVHSDHLTGLALASMLAAGLACAAARWDARTLWLVPLLLALNWFGDSLDGTLARVRRHERPRYGFYVNHVVDIASMTALMAGLGLSGYMSPVVAAWVALGYLLICGEVFLATAARGVFQISFAGIGPTELRILLAVGVIALVDDPHVSLPGWRLRLFDLGGSIAAAGMIVVFVINAWRGTRLLARMEPRPAAARGEPRSSPGAA